MDWSNDLTLEFIRLYGEYPVIWNPFNGDHKNKLKVAESWETIRRTMSKETTIIELKRKKEGLMATFRSLFQKVQHSIRSGVPKNEVYKPSWFCYEAMDSYLHDLYKPKPPLDEVTIEEVDYGDKFEIESSEDVQDESSDSSLNENLVNAEIPNSEGSFHKSVRKKSSTPYLKRKKIRYSSSCQGSAVESQMQDAYSVMKTVSHVPCRERNECEIYGELVAARLKNFDQKIRDTIMNEIDNLIYKAKLNQYAQCQNQNNKLSLNPMKKFKKPL